MHEGISIHLAPEALFHIGSVPITSTLITTFVVSLLLIFFAWASGRALKLKPSKYQAVIEALVMYPYEFVRETLENDKVAERIYPIVMTIFLLVLFQNWFGLLPITGSIPFLYAAGTDINFTLALGIIAFFTTEVIGVMTLGVLKYGGKFITFKSPMAFFVGVMELISELARIITFSFRLFGNIFAGHVLILVVMFFVPLLLPVPFLAFEVFVGFIQAAIFALLTLFFTKIAIEVHEEGNEGEGEGVRPFDQARGKLVT
jgi:F-type H+-transporting ATPase subunit a